MSFSLSNVVCIISSIGIMMNSGQIKDFFDHPNETR